MIILPLCPKALLSLKKASDPVCPRQERLILRVTFGHISGKSPEITVYKDHPSQYITNHPGHMSSKKSRYQYDSQAHNKKKFRKLIHSISSLHKTYQFFFHFLFTFQKLSKNTMGYIFHRFPRKVNKIHIKLNVQNILGIGVRHLLKGA